MTILFSMKDINKSFGPVKVLKNVQLEVEKGEIHALMGENGAGKSTLMNILGGVIQKDSGEILFGNQMIENHSPQIAKDLGIGFVHQEFNLAESLTVAENIYMGRLPYKNEKLGIVDYKKLNDNTEYYLNMLGVNIKPTDVVYKLSTASKQMIEIAKALSLNAKVIIFDEPTTSLSDKDVEVLFIIINALKQKGISSVYISHRMEEIHQLCDRITILRDGQYISTDNVKDLTDQEIIKKLVGRNLDNLYPERNVEVGEIALEVKNLSDTKGAVKNVSFNVRKGEVVGFAGLVGSGRTELMRLVFGADPVESGEIFVKGQKVNIKSPVEAINKGICLLTEDRKNQGVALGLSIKENINMTALKSNIINHKEVKKKVDELVENLQIKISSVDKPVSSLSGGNQQKVVLAKWLNTSNDIYIFDEPTKGIDIGAKSEIYAIINQLVADGKAVIIVSSEIPELLGTVDRIYVLNEGRLTGELSIEESTQEKIMELATLG
ncbi:sugar ABC transporter ATP-binding protein [Globicatella sulfidifaciens]|uniref:Monosaccharide ABC transporter ATP-binding protein, CUT2 family (TC 3.A.1.2.-) n=1 Tax=Globicatella sulfidifaciens DSM 15739 TaxID=1121925 RepID=A0A1T4JQZ9_9LACT|nr:sugar ABC transporter ATP-binding protein [Globicatella sulfidifaciens]SJZ32606.1 monosaccharide ABC transporter ATP-binding protein, CUT2 family (TC 3.A.1.2.-) [Globicatella sulfidifaciens DSM 15739]